MSGSLWLWLLLALTVFWAVGAYNRLIRIRARGMDALGSVERQLNQQAVLVRDHLSNFSETLQPEPNAPNPMQGCQRWQQLQVALDRQDVALKSARASILSIAAMHELTLRYQAVQSAWDALAHAPTDVPQPNLTPELLTAWDEVNRKVDIARSGLNQIVDRYNEAAAQFPASLLVASIGLGVAGPF